MKSKKIIIIILIFIIYKSNSQVQLQSFVGNDGLQFSTIIQKNIDKKLNYFNFTNYYSEYNRQNSGTLEIYNVINYQIYKNIGIAAGNTFNNTDIIPQIGLSWNVDKDNLNFNFFPAINYSVNNKEAGLGIYTLLEYTPKISEKYNFYSMLILDSDFSFKEHSESNQYIRLGAEYKKKFQFGTGINLSEKGINYNFDTSFGVFLGYTLK
jgi:hypothetical protein